MTTETQAPDPGADDMLEPLIYAAIMHNGKPKTVAEFERAAANVADMLQRRAEVTHNKPVASIYISDDGSREFDDWRVDLPPGNHQLFTAPRPDQPQPESLPHPGAPEAEEMIEKLLAECNRPSNMKNAARAGYMAAKRLLQHARQPLPATDDAEPNVQPKHTPPLPEELGQWLTAIGELYVAMGRPPFEATEPTMGVVETLREAAKRLAVQSPAPAHPGGTAGALAEAFGEKALRADTYDPEIPVVSLALSQYLITKHCPVQAPAVTHGNPGEKAGWRIAQDERLIAGVRLKRHTDGSFTAETEDRWMSVDPRDDAEDNYAGELVSVLDALWLAAAPESDVPVQHTEAQR